MVTSTSSSSLMNSRHCSKLRMRWRDQLERFVGPSCTGVGDMLFLAYIHYNIFTLRADADDHAFIDFQAGADKHTATVLRLPKAIAGGLPRLVRDQRPLLAAL